MNGTTEETLFEHLDNIEPRALHGQPHVIWNSASGCYVYDQNGNRYIDFTSGVLVTNSGHNHPRINQAIRDVLDEGLLTSYLFVNKHRVRAIDKILQHSPSGFDNVALFCSGSEAIEAAIKLSKNYTRETISKSKKYVLSFTGNYHGRTLGSQLAGGIPALKSWIGYEDTCFLQIPFPEQMEDETCNFYEVIRRQLSSNMISEDDISCVLFESYQGGTVRFAPTSYVEDLRDWCTDNSIVLVFDEVQAGFGRTGKWWGFENYGIVPDIIVCGKGLSSSLPISAVIGPNRIMDQFPPGAMSTTHSGNPLCAAAAVANIEVLEDEMLVENCQKIGVLTGELLNQYLSKSPIVSNIYGRGLVYGIHITDRQGNPCSKIATAIVHEAVSQGLMLFNPVGPHESTIKVNPPLVIDENIVTEGIRILANAIKVTEEVL